MRAIGFGVLGAVLACVGANPSPGADAAQFEITIKDHQFAPDTLEVPAGQKIALLIHNTDRTPEEFESYQLDREKVVAGLHDMIVYVGPLKPGAYPFFGDFHRGTAQGRLIAK
jgi:hypothetical protein